MTVSAKVIAHSRSAGAPDLITLQCRYPRFIHAEAKTHRVMSIDDAEYEFLQEISFMDDEKLSRNASSSRAIPIERMIQDVIDDPAMPEAWGSEKPGMQAGEDPQSLVLCGASLTEVDRYGPYVSPEQAWRYARDKAVEMARNFSNAGYHKQIANRLLEPFGHISVVVTATDWDNFFDLRCHPDADPTMRALAEAMRDAIAESTPSWNGGAIGEHLPYVTVADQNALTDFGGGVDFREFAMISAARCARVSYMNHDGSDPDIEKDLALAKRLLESKHMSPFEHQAQAQNHGGDAVGIWPPDQVIAASNFTGWTQHRKILEKN